jgi:transcriptional regulator with XRE-family HTH domain
MIDFAKLPDQIRQIRQSRGLSQENVAECLKISTSAYGDIERGKTELTLPRLLAIARVMEVDIESLLGIASDTDAELLLLRETNEKLIRMNLELSFKNELLEARWRALNSAVDERQRIGF